MATAALMTPTTPYNPHQPPSGFPPYHSTHAASGPGMISPVDSRRTSDDTESSHRQSLPSIQEVIGVKSSSFPPQAPATAMTGSQGLPSPFASTHSRHFSDMSQEKNPSPRTLHPTSSFPRADPAPPFSDSRPPMSSRPAPPPPPPPPQPLGAFSRSQPSPPTKLDQHPIQRHHEPEHRLVESHQPNGGYSHPPPPPPPAAYPPPGQLPPGQMPLPGYPISPPRHGAPFDPQRPPLHPDERDYNGRDKYEATLNRHFEAWSYAEYLAKIGSAARTVYNFADAYGRLAQEEHGAHPIPQRLPSDRELADMVSNAEWIKNMLDNIRNVVQQSIMNERAREGARPKPPMEEEDATMYDAKSGYGHPEVKKRRNRAAPPGRCHSCNRIDTPEWRRGPDGARTLCNACGLHYAKLERKRQLELRSIRPRPSEERS